MPVPDLFLEGISRGWAVHDASTFETPREFEADVIIIGTGAAAAPVPRSLPNAG